MPSKSLRVKTRFSADEDVSKAVLKIERNTQRMNRSVQRGFRESTRAVKAYEGVMKGVLAAGVIQKVFGLVGQRIREAATQFVSFDGAITAAALRFKDIGPDAKDFAKKLDTIKAAAREAGLTTIFTATEAASALDFMARAGFNSEEAMGGLRSMINLSIATGEDFATVADWSSDLLGAFGLAVDDSAQKIKNLNRLNNVLAKTANTANVKVEDMFETMKDIGPIAAGILKVSLEDVAAQTAVLGNSGIKGTIAMTALKNAYLNLAAPVGDGAKILKMFNISLKDGKGGVRTLTDVLSELDDKMKLKGLDPVDQAKVMDAIFGKRAIAGAKNLMDNIKNVEKFKASLLGIEGYTDRVAGVMAGSLGNELKSLGSAFLEFGFKFMDPWEKTMKEKIRSVTNEMRNLDPTWISKELLDTFSEESFLFRLLSGKLKAKSPFVQGLLDFFSEKNLVFAALPDFMTDPGGFRGTPYAMPSAGDKKQTAQGEIAKMHQNMNPAINVEVNQNISSDTIKADTTVKAPGGSGKVNRNNF